MMKRWKPETGHELTRCRICGSTRIRPVFYILFEGEGFAYTQCILHQCTSCKTGIVHRLDYDSFDWEAVFAQHEWYMLDAQNTEELLVNLGKCSTPEAPHCQCSTHRSLRDSLNRLPRSSWEWVFEDEMHVHQIRARFEKGLPILEVQKDRANRVT